MKRWRTLAIQYIFVTSKCMLPMTTMQLVGLWTKVA